MMIARTALVAEDTRTTAAAATAALLLLATGLPSSDAAAQAFPARPIRLMIPASP